MTTILAQCPHCTLARELRRAELHLMVCANRPSVSYYAFDCTRCGPVRRPAEPLVMGLLLSNGIRPVLWSVPAEALEAHAGPVISEDDILDLLLALERVDA